MTNKLKPINSFEVRSRSYGYDVTPKFDTGDIITNGDGNNMIISNITSCSDSNTYYTVMYQHQVGKSPRLMEYHKTSKEYELLKKSNTKLQYYISNEGELYPDLYDIAMGNAEYPIWFEKAYNKLIKKNKV
jgi:hypothetical protein